MPASQREQDLASTAKEQAQPLLSPFAFDETTRG